MPTLRRRLVMLLALATFGAALPAPAVHAQGAGDEQYQDPFEGTQTQEQPPAQTTPSSPPPAPAPAPAPVAPAAASAQSAPQTVPAAELPRTGFDARPAAVAGLLLLLVGLVLRRRTGPEHR